jgi:tetratricopeptide (TPR) repeat protein
MPALPEALQLTQASEEDLSALRRALEWSEGFALFIVVCDGPARVDVLRRLKAWSGDGGVPVLRFLPSGRAGVDAVEQLLAPLSPGQPLSGAVIVDGDTMVAERTPMHALNAARDRLASLIDGPLILLVSPARAAELATMASDLFDIRAVSYQIEAIEPSRIILAPSALAQVSDEDLPDPAHLRALESSAHPPPAGALADAWRHLAKAYIQRGDMDSGAGAARESIRLAVDAAYLRGVTAAFPLLLYAQGVTGPLEAEECQLRDALERLKETSHDRATADVLRADVLRALAVMLHAQGRLDEAQRCLHDALTAYGEGPDYAQARASAMEQMASIWASHGEIEEAIRILKQEVLPVYEEARDTLSHVRVMMEIAELLRSRGDLDEALRLLNQHVFPIVLTFPLVDTVIGAAAKASVGRILADQGNLDLAVRVLRDLVIPVFEQKGNLHHLVRWQIELARVVLARGEPGDLEAAEQLLRIARETAERLQLPELEQIRRIAVEHGLRTSAPEIPPPDSALPPAKAEVRGGQG